MKKSILFWLLFAPLLSYSQIEKISITNNLKTDKDLQLKGTIISLIDQKPLPFITVYLIQNGKTITQAQSDFDGHYSLKHIEPGVYSLRVLDHDSNKSKTFIGVKMVKETTKFIDIKLATTYKPKIAVCGSKPNINNIPNKKLNSDSLHTLLPSYQLFNNPLESSITIYPNPSSGLVTVTNPLTTKSYTLYDLSGKVMCKQEYFDQKNLTLDITTYQKGIYLLKIEDKLGVQIQRLIKN